LLGAIKEGFAPNQAIFKKLALMATISVLKDMSTAPFQSSIYLCLGIIPRF
jgi:hypothetical protein